jgi:hypothetical protein
VILTCATHLASVRPTLLDRVRRSENRWFSKIVKKKGSSWQNWRTDFSADAAFAKVH